jgi:hypothetical protein
MIDFAYEVKLEHWGIIEEIGEDYITIFREAWAPGIWAGVKNQQIVIKQRGDGFYKCAILVTHCDLDERKLFFKCHINGHNMEEGDTLHFVEKVTVEYEA